jgi:hypothetical protein
LRSCYRAILESGGRIHDCHAEPDKEAAKALNVQKRSLQEREWAAILFARPSNIATLTQLDFDPSDPSFTGPVFQTAFSTSYMNVSSSVSQIRLYPWLTDNTAYMYLGYKVNGVIQTSPGMLQSLSDRTWTQSFPVSTGIEYSRESERVQRLHHGRESD